MQFQLIQSVFCSIEIVFKTLMESLSILINQNCCFDQSNVENKVFKKFKFDLFKPLFQNFFSLSLRLSKAPQQIFCRFPPNFLQGFSLHKPICSYYPFFSFIFSFSCIFSCIEGLFSDLAYFGVFDDSNLIL